jgi:hypothetical protein
MEIGAAYAYEGGCDLYEVEMGGCASRVRQIHTLTCPAPHFCSSTVSMRISSLP